jgi:arginine/ornithine N-succinyltransferase beta subunit
MLPRQVLYSSILDPEAQRSLGQIRDDQAWLMEALLELGFMPYRHVRIDDGGPVLISRC